MQWLPRSEVLTFEEIERIAGLMVRRYGVDSIRLTGGEPTVRANIVGLVERLAALHVDGRPVDLAMTTNGAMLRLLPDRCARRGSIGSTSASIRSTANGFFEMTRRDELHRVLDGMGGRRPGSTRSRSTPSSARRQRRRDPRPGHVRAGAGRRGAVHRVHAARRLRRLDRRLGRRPGGDSPGSAPLTRWSRYLPEAPLWRTAALALRRRRDGRRDPHVTKPFCGDCDRPADRRRAVQDVPVRHGRVRPPAGDAGRRERRRAGCPHRASVGRSGLDTASTRSTSSDWSLDVAIGG